MAALGQQVTIEAARTDSGVTGTTAGSSTVQDASITGTDQGRYVSATGIPTGCTVGPVTTGQFTLVGPNGFAIAATGATGTLNLGASLVYLVVDPITYETTGFLPASFPNCFKSGDNNTPLPLLIGLTGTTTYFGGETVTSSATGIGAAFSTATLGSLSYNCIGGDSLYAVVASSTATLQLLALRQ